MKNTRINKNNRRKFKHNKTIKNKNIRNKYKKGGGNYYQDNLKSFIQQNPIKNYKLDFLPNNSLNFDVTFDDEKLDTYIDNRCKEFFPQMESAQKIMFDNINIIAFLSDKDNCSIFDNTDFLNSDITRANYKIIDNYKIIKNDSGEKYDYPYDVLYVLRIIHLLKREIKSNNVYLNGSQLLKGSDAIISYTYTCKIYSTILQNIKIKKPNVTNDDLTRILFLLNASGDRILQFFQLGLINSIRENLEDIGVLTFSGANNYDTNLLNYIRIYEQSINNLFNINSPGQTVNVSNSMNKTIFDYINNVFQHYINIVDNEIIVTTYCTYFLTFFVNESLQGKTTRKEKILFGIAMDEIKTNINQNIMSNNFRYRWMLNNKTKNQLNSYDISKQIPFYYNIPVVHSEKNIMLQKKSDKGAQPSFRFAIPNIFSKKGGKKNLKSKQNKSRKLKK